MRKLDFTHTMPSFLTSSAAPPVPTPVTANPSELPPPVQIIFFNAPPRFVVLVVVLNLAPQVSGSPFTEINALFGKLNVDVNVHILNLEVPLGSA